MQTYRFTKAEGAQNDFVIVEDLEREIPVHAREAFTRAVCHRRKGVGADGAIFLERSAEHDFTMAFYNPDGTSGSMCGNGGRCAALFARLRGVAPATMTFDVLGQRYAAAVDGDLVRIDFPQPRIVKELRVADDDGLLACAAHFVQNGAPHLVVFSDGLSRPKPLAQLDVAAIGAALRASADFAPVGTNVNFAEISTDGLVHVRTFEKGVEAETEACGTGTIAVAMIAHASGGFPPPLRLRTHGGDTLVVDFDPDPTKDVLDAAHYARLSLEGPARLVFDGEITI